jgi:Ca2+-binding RTX toxin-like protein
MTEFSSNYNLQQNAYVKLRTGNGNDQVKGESKFGILDIATGGGNDVTTIQGMGGLTMLDNAAGDDTNYIFNIFANNKVNNGSGDDTNNIFTYYCENAVNNGSGDDKNIINGFGNINTINNGSGDDTTVLQGSNNRNLVGGGSGDDSVYVSNQGQGNYNVVNGGSGFDKVVFEGSPNQYNMQMSYENGQVYRVFTDVNGNVTKVAGDVENIQFTQPGYVQPQPQPQPQPYPQPYPIQQPPQQGVNPIQYPQGQVNPVPAAPQGGQNFLEGLASWFFAAMNSILNPPQPVAANEVGTITGDPHFKGGDGGKYDVQGEPGKTYNLLSDNNLQFNGRFDAWGGGGATVVGETGLTVGGPGGMSAVTFNKDGTAKVNGQELQSGQTVQLADGGYARKEGNKLIIQTAEGYTITQTVHGSKNGNYINTEVKTGAGGVAQDGVLPGGLLGQTFDPDSAARNGAKGAGAQGEGAINGHVNDYQVGGLIPMPQPYPMPAPYPQPYPYPMPQPAPTPTADPYIAPDMNPDGRLDGGTNRNDYVRGTNSQDTLMGRNGNDTMVGRKGNDWMHGGAGNDRIYGGKGNDVIYGGTGNDYIRGDKGNDVLVGGAGDDRISGGKGNDVIYGGAGNDRIDGGKGNDRISVGEGSDKVNAGKGNDYVHVNSAQQHGTTQDINLGKGDDKVVVNAADGTNNTYNIKGGKGEDNVELNIEGGFHIERPGFFGRMFGKPQYVIVDSNGNKYNLEDFNPKKDNLVINGQQIDPRMFT